MPTKDLVCSTFTLIAQKSARQTFCPLKEQRDKRRGALVQCLPRAWHKRSHRMGAGHVHPLLPLAPSFVCSLFLMTEAQIAAESTETLPQTVCRWIIALLWLLSLLVSAWEDQRVPHNLEDPKPGMKLHHWSFPSQAASSCCVGFTGSVLRHVMCPTHHMWPLNPQRKGLTVRFPASIYITCATAAPNAFWGKVTSSSEH